MTLHHSNSIKYIIIRSHTNELLKLFSLPVLKDKALPQLKMDGKVTVVAHTVSS